MNELIWIHGEVMPLKDATISVEDRGFQFADGVYEVARVYNGRCFALRPHIDRLERSANGIKLALNLSKGQLCNAIEALVEQSNLADGMVYVQLTRGVCARNHVFPAGASCTPTLLFYTRKLPPLGPVGGGEGVKLISVPDVRWRMCWIKSIALLANVLAKNEAAAAGAEEAVFVEDGYVSECSTSNLFFVIEGTLVTHPLGPKVLPGITREYLLACARETEVPVDERAVRESDAIRADEIFISSTTREISWVSRWNQQRVGGERCGPVTAKLHHALRERVGQETRGPIVSPDVFVTSAGRAAPRPSPAAGR
jgi:D-alanine transaminase